MPDEQTLRALSPAATYVFDVLTSEGPQPRHALIERTHLPPSTTDSALQELRREGLVERQPSGDGRSPYYSPR